MDTKDKLIHVPVQTVEIGADTAGQRIDNFLINHLKTVPRGHVYRILRRGEVRVNSGRKQATYRLKTGDMVRVPPILKRPRSEGEIPPDAYTKLAPSILYEDDQILVFNKPSGLAVHGGSELSFGLIEIVKRYHPRCQKLELVHRLDKETSGCLLLAKNRPTLTELNKIFHQGHCHKLYAALIQGQLPKAKLTVRDKLEKRKLGGEHMVIITPDGKPAHSEFCCLQRFKGASFVNVMIKTGRTHQIRVHAAMSLKQPVAGDHKYGDKNFNVDCRRYGLRRLFLHASELSFELCGREYRFVAPLPMELTSVLSALESEAYERS